MHTVVHDGVEPNAPSGSSIRSAPPAAIVRDGARPMPAAALRDEVAAYVTTPATARHLSIAPNLWLAIPPPLFSAG